MAPTVIRVMSVAGKSRDSAAVLNPRLDAEKSGMASIFNIQTQRLERVRPPIRRNFTQMWWRTTL